MKMAQKAGVVVTGEAVWKLCELVAAETLKNSVMADEGQRTRLTFDAEVIEMVKEAVEMEREACAKAVSDVLYGQDGCGKAIEAIRARGSVNER